MVDTYVKLDREKLERLAAITSQAHVAKEVQNGNIPADKKT